MAPVLSIVVPVFNEAQIIRNSIKCLINSITEIGCSYEIILIDDGSDDPSWSIINEISKEIPFVKGIRFSRNYGKEQAVFAGLGRSAGEAVVIIDADLQHPPIMIPKMFSIWKNGGIDIVRAVKSDRGNESRSYKIMSTTFYLIMKKLSGLDLENASDFVLLDQKVVAALKNFPEKKPFLRGFLSFIGFRQATIEFDVAPRSGGSSKWSRTALLKYALSNVLAFSSLPLRIVNYLAFLFLFFAFVLGSYAIYQYLIHNALEGFTTVIILLLLMGSCIMTGLGIIGEYLSRIHEEVKNRPRHLILEEINIK